MKPIMQTYSTREAAKKLGITGVALGRYLKLGKVSPPPNTAKAGMRTIQLWTDADIERVRGLLPKIANGRKTRWQKLRQKQKAPAAVPMPHKKRKLKK